VESAIRITGSSGSVTVFSAAFLVADFESVGQAVFGAEVERSRISCAPTNRSGADKITTKSNKAEMIFETLFMMKD